MNNNIRGKKTKRFASWISTFPFNSSAIRLHEISWVEMEPGVSFPYSRINRLLFCYTTKGSGALRYKDETHVLRSGECFISDMSIGVEVSSLEQGWSIIWLQMSSSLVYDLFKHVENDRGNIIHSDPQIPALCDQIYELASNKSWSASADIGLSTLLYKLMGLLITSTSTPLDNRLLSILEYIHKNFSEKLSSNNLAKLACMSPYYFIRRFKKQIGVTPVEYINEYRITQAQKLLASTDIPIFEVAYKVGIEDPSYFSQLFKKITGILPKEYKNLFK